MSDAGRHFRVLMIAPTPFFSDRGTHIRILEEARALVRRGHEVKIVTYHIGGDIPKSPESDRIETRRILRLLFWYKKLEAGPDWQKVLLDVMLARKAFNLARTWKPDIVHGHLHEGVLIGWAVRRMLFFRRMRLVADFHGSLTKEMVSHAYLRQGPLRALFRFVERTIDELGDAAVASSWSNAEEISRFRTGTTVEPAIDGAVILPSPDESTRSAIRKRYGVPEDAVVATYTGAFVDNKGIDLLVRSVRPALEGDSSLFFVLAGAPGERASAMLEREGNPDRVAVVSPLPYGTLGDILGMSDIGLEPKHDDTGQASGKMLQYMGAGLPVVCFGTRNNREYLGDGGTYVEEPTPEKFAEAVISLSGKSANRRSIGDRNRERAEDMSWDRTGEALERIYADVMKEQA